MADAALLDMRIALLSCSETQKEEWFCVYKQVKVKLSLCLTKHQAMKTYWGSRVIASRILDLGTGWR
jgi:hypothetical protein